MPGRYNKAKGNTFERTCVSRARFHGLEAKRSWGSDGRSRDLPEEVDITVGGLWHQCKSRKKIASHIIPKKGYIQLIKGNNQGEYAVLPLDIYYDLLALRGNNMLWTILKDLESLPLKEEERAGVLKACNVIRSCINSLNPGLVANEKEEEKDTEKKE